MRLKLHIFHSAIWNEKLFHLLQTIRFRIAVFTIPVMAILIFQALCRACSRHFLKVYSQVWIISDSDEWRRRKVEFWKLKRNRRRVFSFCLEVVNVSATGVEHNVREKHLISIFACECDCISSTSKRSLKTRALYALAVVHLRLIKWHLMVCRTNEKNR